MEVEKTNLDGYTQGAILGKFINEPTQDIKGGVVLPLVPNMKHIPLKGEDVLVGDYNNQHYYFGIINSTNSVNENAQPGIAEGSSNTTNTKYGKTFERKDIRPVTVNEGEIVYSGRVGQSIKFGCNTLDNSPNIKIRCGQKSEIPDSPNQPVKEDIERDGSSIYLLDNGLPYNAQDDSELFDGEQIENKKILIKSDGIFISGRNNIKLRCINNITVDTPNFNVSGDEVQLGSTETAELQPVVKGDDLINLLDDMQFGIFYDYGNIKQYKDLLNISMTTPNKYSLKGWGAFLDMFAGRNYSLKLGVADSLSGNPGKTNSGNNSDGKDNTWRYWFLGVFNLK